MGEEAAGLGLAGEGKEGGGWCSDERVVRGNERPGEEKEGEGGGEERVLRGKFGSGEGKGRKG